VNLISVRGAQEHNLKTLDVDIPKNCFVAFTGVSGSGKSSLVFDTIYAEAFRRFVDASDKPLYVMGDSVWSKLTRPRFRAISGLPPALGLSQRQGVASKTSTVGTLSGVTDLFRVYFAAFGDVSCKTCDIPLHAMDFSTISKKVTEKFDGKKVLFIATLAEKRKGGFVSEIEHFRELGFSKLRVNSELFDLQNDKIKIKIDVKKLNTIEIIIDALTVAPERQNRIDRAIAQALEHGKGILTLEVDQTEVKFNTRSSCPQCGESAPKLDPRYFSHSSLGKCLNCDGTGSENILLPNDLFPCKFCKGTRLHKDTPIVRVCGKTFDEIHSLPLVLLKDFIVHDMKFHVEHDKAKKKVHSELARMAQSMHRLNLDHLILNRSGNSLTPGDLQRLRLASMISNKLTGAMYVIDEPCQGLTSHEVLNLTHVLQNLVQKGASVIAVEHHPTFLSQTDVLFVMGPGAGKQGGEVISIHKKPFPHKTKHTVPKKHNPTENTPHIAFSHIAVRNLKIEHLTLEQGCCNIIRGKSGAGKASFVDLCLVPALESLGGKHTEDREEHTPFHFKAFCKMEAKKNIDVQIISYVKPGSQIRSSKRTVAAALDVIKPIRQIFASLPQSQVMGLSESHFSWNSKLGHCTQCEGKGYLELAQKYAKPVRVECELCLGTKLNSRSLVPRFKGYNLADIMNLSLEQAAHTFENQKIISNRIAKACQFGLGYIQLGQGMDTLSGGELQRLTLTLELKRATLEGAWFILIHPSTGLHEPDIVLLGELMKVMTAKGATFVAIENREEFLPYADNVVTFS